MSEYPLNYAVDHGDKERAREPIDSGVNVNRCISSGETPLLVAVRKGRKGRRDIFELIIQNGAQVSSGKEGDGWKPLHWASFNGWGDQVWLILEKGDNGPGADLNAAANDGETERRGIFDLLIQHGAQVNYNRESDFWTPLHTACSEGWHWVDQVRLILEKGENDPGADLNAAENNGYTPLMVAASYGSRGPKEIFDLLLQYGAQVNCGRESDGCTPLHWACYNGWVDQVRLILEKGGADLNAAANDGKTPLFLAAREGHRDVFDLLLQYGAQVNCGRDGDGWTPLHWACSNGWVDQLRLILEKGGADLNAVANDGETPLFLAASEGHRDVFDLLLQYGAQVNCGRDGEGWTPFHCACSNGWADQVRLILDKGKVDLNAATNYGETPLRLAAIEGHRDIFDLLIQYGAQVSNCGKDGNGCTPLHWACSYGWVDQVRHILEKGGADLNAAVNGGITPLFLAAREGHIEIFDLLLQYGAQVNGERDNEGWTLLYLACSNGWVDQVRLILEKGGANLNAADNDGYTPLKIAMEYGHREIFILLLQYGATMDIDYALFSKHSILNVFEDVNLCSQLIVNEFHCQSLPSLYRIPDIAKRLPFSKHLKLKDQQKQEIAKFVESEVKTRKFCNVFKSQPIVLMLLCVQSLLGDQSISKMSASSDSNLPF